MPKKGRFSSGKGRLGLAAVVAVVATAIGLIVQRWRQSTKQS